MPDYFGLVTQIRNDDKYFDVSVPEMVRSVTDAGEINARCEHCVSTDGGEVYVELKLRVGGSPVSPDSWAVAMIMQNRRIDGIDHEDWFNDIDGNECEGWHRHMWNPSVCSCEDYKVPVAGLDDAPALEYFLYRALREMKIIWSQVDHGDGVLLTEN